MNGTIGGSDVAAILGFSPWATPFDAWNSIMFGRSSAGNAATDRGNRLEPAVLDWYSETQRPILARQVEVLEAGGTITQETRLWDTNKGETRSLRSKEDAHDYRYFPEPDLLPLVLEDGVVEAHRGTLKFHSNGSGATFTIRLPVK